MSSFLKLDGVDFSNNSLPKLESFSNLILGLPGLLSWVSAADYYTHVNDAGLVSRMVDRSGNNNDFAQAAEGSQPDLIKDELNGNNVIRFDSANKEFMQYAGTFPTLATESYVKLIVVKVPEPTGTANILSSNSPTAVRHSLFCTSNSTYVTMESNTSGPTKQIDFTDGWHLLIAEFNADTSQHLLMMDNETLLTDNVTAEAREDDLFLGAADVAGNGAATMDVAEVMVLNQSVISNADNLAMIQRYVAGKYGLDLS